MDPLLTVLSGHVWHATGVSAFKAILQEGIIRIRPPASRHSGSFCQSLQRVSLFDFRPASKRAEAIERGDWSSFIDIHPDDMSIWLRLKSDLIDIPTAAMLLSEWKEVERAGQLAGRARIIRDLETGYAEDIPLKAIADVLLIDGQSPDDLEVVALDAEVLERLSTFKHRIAKKERTGIAATMRAASRRLAEELS